MDTHPDQRAVATLRILDDAVARLGDPSSDYRRVLRDAVAALPAEAGQVTADVQGFLGRLPPADADFGCGADFVRRKARQALQRFRDSLLNEPPAGVEPEACRALPIVLDATRLRGPGGVAHIYGFDFDTAPLQLVVASDRGLQDVTAALVVRSHYHLVVKLGDGGVLPAPGSRSLGLAWGHLIHHSIPLAEPASRICSPRVETIPPGRTVSYIPPRARRGWILPRSGKAVSADASLDFSSNKLELSLCVTASDPTLSGCTVEFLYTTDADRVIDAIFDDLSSTLVRQRARRAGPVDRWGLFPFRPDGIAEGQPLVSARLNRIRLVSIEGDRCLSPIAYSEAKRMSVLDPATVRALDPQLLGIDRTVLRLRPRFAPALP